MPRILGIAGSVRRGSYNRMLVRAAGRALPPGACLVEWDGLAHLPAFDEDREASPPPPVADFLSEVAAAHGLVISTPEYNHSLPGALKNALDWASRPIPGNVLRHKPCLVVGASTGLFGAVWAQAEVRKALKASGAHVLESELPVGLAEGAFTAAGELADRELAGRLALVVGELVAETKTAGERAA